MIERERERENNSTRYLWHYMGHRRVESIIIWILYRDLMVQDGSNRILEQALGRREGSL